MTRRRCASAFDRPGLGRSNRVLPSGITRAMAFKTCSLNSASPGWRIQSLRTPGHERVIGAEHVNALAMDGRLDASFDFEPLSDLRRAVRVHDDFLNLVAVDELVEGVLDFLRRQTLPVARR